MVDGLMRKIVKQILEILLIKWSILYYQIIFFYEGIKSQAHAI